MICPKCGEEMGFRTYNDIFNGIEVCPRCGFWRSISKKAPSRKRTSNYVPNKGKYKSCTLIPMIHWDWGEETLMFVEKDDIHPDPSGLLTWGYGVGGGVYPGDYNDRFKRAGKSITFEYSIEGCGSAMQEKFARVCAIRKAIREYMDNMIQLRKIKPTKKKRKVK